jgi:putative transposase
MAKGARSVKNGEFNKPHEVGMQVSHMVWFLRSTARRYTGSCEVWGPIYRELARQRECEVIEEHPLPNHMHMLILVPTIYLVSPVVGYLKGKNAIQIARTYMGRKKNFTGRHFGAQITTYRRSERMRRRSWSKSGDRSMNTVIGIN